MDGLAISPDGRSAYVTNDLVNGKGGTVSVVDLATNAVSAPIPVDRGVREVVITPDGRSAYVTNPGTTDDPRGGVTVIDTATHTVTARIVLAPYQDPTSGAITPDGLEAYVVDNEQRCR